MPSPRAEPWLRVSMYHLDPLANDWCDVRLLAVLREPRHEAHFIFNGRTYKRSEYEPLVDEVIHYFVVDPRFDGTHDGQRLLPTYWLLVDDEDGRAFVLPAAIAKKSVIAQRPVGWTPPAPLWLPFADTESEGQ